MQEAPNHGDRWFKDAVEQAATRERIDALMREMTTATKSAGTPLGATGHFPGGALTPDDEGELRLAVTATGGQVVLAFGKAVEWIGLPPSKARELAKLLGEYADRA